MHSSLDKLVDFHGCKSSKSYLFSSGFRSIIFVVYVFAVYFSLPQSLDQPSRTHNPSWVLLPDVDRLMTTWRTTMDARPATYGVMLCEEHHAVVVDINFQHKLTLVRQTLRHLCCEIKRSDNKIDRTRK